MIKLVGAERCRFLLCSYGTLSQRYDDTSKKAKNLGPKDKTKRRGMGRRVIIFASGRPDGSIGMLGPGTFVDVCCTTRTDYG